MSENKQCVPKYVANKWWRDTKGCFPTLLVAIFTTSIIAGTLALLVFVSIKLFGEDKGDILPLSILCIFLLIVLVRAIVEKVRDDILEARDECWRR